MSTASVNNKGNELILSNDYIRLIYDKSKARFHLGFPEDSPLIINSRISVVLSINGKKTVICDTPVPGDHTEKPLQDVHGTGRQVNIVRNTGSGFPISILFNIYNDKPFILARITVSNTTSETVSLNELRLLDASAESEGSVEFPEGRSAPDFLKVGWHDWCYTGLRRAHQREIHTLIGHYVGQMYFNPTTPSPWRRGDFWGEGWGILAGRDQAVVTGFVSMADQFGQVHAVCGKKSSSLSLIAQADGVLLEPGESFQSEWGYVQFVRLPDRNPADEYVRAAARQMNARNPETPPPAKWTHWYHYFHNITEDLFIANLDVIDRIRDVLPFKTVQLDDGYQSAWGDWYSCNEKFPQGLKYLADRISSKNFTPGLWVAPFVADPKSKLAREHPDWLLTGRNGKPIVSGFFWDFFGHSLDATNPAVLDWLRELMHTIVYRWGFKFVKTDFVYAGALPGNRFNPKLTRAQTFRRGMQAIREGLGDDTFLLGCGCPFGPAVGIVDAIRVGPDTAPNWTPYLWNMQWAGPFIKHEKGIGSLRNNIRQTLNLSVLHDRWWCNDPDCLMVRDFDTNLNDEEIRSNVSIIGLNGGLVINSDDLTRLSSERQKLASLLVPILSSNAQPLDLLEKEMAELYDLEMHRPWQDWHVTAVFNWGDRNTERTLDLKKLALDADKPFHVFDFWNRTYRLHAGSALELGEVAPHGCRLLRVSPHDGAPRIIGSTLHITQGGEISEMKAEKGMLGFTVSDLGRTVEGDVWLWIPADNVTAQVSGGSAVLHKHDDGIWILGIKAKGAISVNLEWKE